MARYCSKCEKKFGFFEQDFDGLCENCYNVKIENERIEIQKERERKQKEEEQRKKEEEQIRRKKQEEAEKRRLEEEQRRKIEEEQRKKAKEEENKKNEEKYKNFKSDYMNNPRIMQLYVHMVECIKEEFFCNIFKDENEENYVANGIEFFIRNTIYKLPEGFKLKDLEKINTSKTLLDIIAKNGNILSIGNLIDEEEYGSFKRIQGEASEDGEEIVLEFEDNLFFVDINILTDKVYESKERFDANEEQNRKWMYDFPGDAGAIYRDYYAMKCLLFSYKYLFYWALIFIYNAVFFSYKDKFEKSELNTIYNKLQESTQDVSYIINKLYELYSQLYRADFDIELSKRHIIELISIELWSNSLKILTLKASIVSASAKTETSLKELDINSKNKDTFYIFCKEILRNEIVEKSLNNALITEEINMDYIIFVILQVILDEAFGVCDNKKLKYKDLIYYRDILIKVIEDINNDKSMIEAEKERDRILRGDFSKEIEIQKQEVEYSNVRNGYEFEEYVANLYKKLGYTIEEVTKKSGDQGADVIAYKDNIKYVIQAKFYNNPVGNKAVQEVVASIGMYKADKGIVVTNSTYTPSAVELANANNIELVDGERIEEFKNEIIKNIKSYNEEVTEEYIDDIANKWNDLLQQENLPNDESSADKAFELLAKVYIEKEGVEALNEENKIESFVKGFSKYISLGDNILIENREDKDGIEILLKKSIYKEYFIISKMNSIFEDNIIEDEERKERIYYEYISDNTENIFEVYKVMALSDILNETGEEVIKEIQYYKEKFENDLLSNIISTNQEILELSRSTSRLLKELGINSEENYELDGDYDDIQDYNNDFEEENTFNFFDNDDLFDE